LQVPGCKPHELTHAFTKPTLANPTPTSFQHVAPWLQTSPATNPSPMPLYRALELLDVKPWGYGIGHGGRVAGKININMIWDSPIEMTDTSVMPSVTYYRSQVLEALLDKNSTNSFTDVARLSDVQRVYNMLFGQSVTYARTKSGPSGVPGNTVDEVTPTQANIDAADRPFRPFGTASLRSQLPVTGSGNFAFAQQGLGLQDTILRSVNPSAANAVPAIFTSASHPYQQAEMLRKMYNNFTTTSDTFLVVMTVGFFEVRNQGPYHVNNPTILGRELFDETPHDLRAKFSAIIDRSMLATTSPTTATGQQPTRHFYSELTSDLVIPANNTTMDNNNNVTVTATIRGQTQLGADVFYEGQQVRLGTGNVTALYFGTGPDRLYLDALTIPTMPAPTGDVITLQKTNFTVKANTPQRIIPKGTVVSNAAPGNPGEQFFFDATAPQYRGVVPYFERIPNR
jgi:hypothetical protein